MGKRIEPRSVKEGDILNTRKGRFIAMWDGRMNRKGSINIEGTYEKDVAVMLKNPKDTTKMRFYTWTFRGRSEPVEVVGKVQSATVKKLREMNSLLQAAVEKRRGEKMNALDLKWNPNATVKHGWKRWQGAYDVVTKKGEHVKSGDLVMVQFKNGQFEMVMGNENGATYDPKTGNFLCRATWKVGRPEKYKMKYDPRYGVIPKKVTLKARSLPPDSLLYLIKSKEEYEKERGLSTY